MTVVMSLGTSVAFSGPSMHSEVFGATGSGFLMIGSRYACTWVTVASGKGVFRTFHCGVR